MVVVVKWEKLQMDRNRPRGAYGHRSSILPTCIVLCLFVSIIICYLLPFEVMKDEMSKESSNFVAQRILPHILNLYSRATPKDFEIYAPNATFEDPLMCAHGVKQIKSAFYSLSKVFSESRIVDYSITEEETSPGKTEISIDNKQYYKFLGKDIDMISLIKLYTEDGKVVRHEDRWDKKPLRNRETVKTPLVGHVMEATRRASMLATHALMRFGKDPSN